MLTRKKQISAQICPEGVNCSHLPKDHNHATGVVELSLVPGMNAASDAPEKDEEIQVPKGFFQDKSGAFFPEKTHVLNAETGRANKIKK